MKISYSRVIGKNLRLPCLNKRLLELREHVTALDLAGKTVELLGIKLVRVI